MLDKEFSETLQRDLFLYLLWSRRLISKFRLGCLDHIIVEVLADVPFYCVIIYRNELVVQQLFINSELTLYECDLEMQD